MKGIEFSFIFSYIETIKEIYQNFIFLLENLFYEIFLVNAQMSLVNDFFILKNCSLRNFTKKV